MNDVKRRHHPRCGRSWGRISVTIAAALAVVAAGCAKTPPALDPPPTAIPQPQSATPSPTASASELPSASNSPSVTPSGPGSTPSSPGLSPSGPGSSPSTTPSAKPAVRATGSLSLYGPATKKLAGTCATVSGVPTLTAADRANDFFGTVEASMVLSAHRTTVATLTITLGEDADSVARRLTYGAAQPAKDTSVDLTMTGATFTAKGKLSNTENGQPAGTVPVTLAITCAGTDW